MEATIYIKEKIKKFIIEASFSSEDQISNDTLIFTEGIMDSIGFISIISFLEETFQVVTLDYELVDSNFESVNSIARFVTEKLNRNNISG